MKVCDECHGGILVTVGHGAMTMAVGVVVTSVVIALLGAAVGHFGVTKVLTISHGTC